MKNAKFIVPNTLTLINLFLGCIAIVVLFKGNEYNASWFIFLAAIFDLFDGLAARALKAKSEFGVQLDSLADLVSFGVAPSMILFNWFVLVLTQKSSTYDFISANFSQKLILFSSLLFALAVAIRLARFNVTTNGSRTFQGLTSTAAGLMVAAVWLVWGSTEESERVMPIILNIYFVYGFLAFMIILMLSKIRMISLKFRGVSFSANVNQYIIIIVSAALILIFKTDGVLYSLVFYLLYSIIMNFFPSAEA